MYLKSILSTRYMCLDLNSDSEPTIDIDSWDLYRVSAHWWGGRVKLNQHLNQFTLLHILPCNICSIRFNTCCYAWVFALIAKYLLGLLYSPGSLLFICCVRESCRLHWFPSRFRLSIINSLIKGTLVLYTFYFWLLVGLLAATLIL
jgi:hypothetical protein